MLIGERLKKAREDKGYTQVELARVTGVKQQMISKLETGRANATADIVRLAYALNVEPAWLEGISENPAPYTRRVSSRSTLNEKVIEPAFEFIRKEYKDIFDKSTPAKQAQIFMSCYEICVGASYASSKNDKKSLYSAMHKALKNKPSEKTKRTKRG